MATPNLRTVVREHKFEEHLVYIESQAKRADELVEGIEWILARDPEVGDQTNKENVWVYYSAVTIDTPAIAVYYTFNDTHVFMLDVMLVERNGN